MSGECFIKMEYFYSILMEALIEKITGLEKELRENRETDQQSGYDKAKRRLKKKLRKRR